MAPQTTGEALKGGRLVAEVLARGGFTVIPAPGLPDTPSMITAVELGSRERMVAFCRWGGGEVGSREQMVVFCRWGGTGGQLLGRLVGQPSSAPQQLPQLNSRQQRISCHHAAGALHMHRHALRQPASGGVCHAGASSGAARSARTSAPSLV